MWFCSWAAGHANDEIAANVRLEDCERRGRSSLCEVATIAPAPSGRTLFVGVWIYGLLSADPGAFALVLSRMLDES